METIYLDHNSTTPTHPAVIHAMRPFWSETFGNPASAHHVGRKARQALEDARATVARLLDAEPGEVVFTSGATEANNLAIHGLLGEPAGAVVSSAIEHPSVNEPIRQAAQRGFVVVQLPVDSCGMVTIDPPHAIAARLVTLMLANNETGAIQPVRELRVQSEAPFHCDAVQAAGKMPVSFHSLGVTTLSLSAHKFQGPRGIGALLMKKGTRLKPLFWGGHQQQGLRPGTEPVALAVGLAAALRMACEEMEPRAQRCRTLRDEFLNALQKEASPIVLNGPKEGGLPHTLNVSFPGCRAEALLIRLDLAGVACSTGSACSSGSLMPSPVLQAMGCPPDVLHSAMRFSFSHETSEADLVEGAQRIGQAVRALRAMAWEEE